MHILIKFFRRIHLRFKSFSYLYTLLEKSARIEQTTSTPQHLEMKKEKTIYKMTHKWNYQPITPRTGRSKLKQLAKELGISPILGKIAGGAGNNNGSRC